MNDKTEAREGGVNVLTVFTENGVTRSLKTAFVARWVGIPTRVARKLLRSEEQCGTVELTLPAHAEHNGAQKSLWWRITPAGIAALANCEPRSAGGAG